MYDDLVPIYFFELYQRDCWLFKDLNGQGRRLNLINTSVLYINMT